MINKQIQRRSRAVSLLLAAIVLALLPCGARPAHARTEAPYKPNEVIVKINPASGATITTINAAYGTTTLRRLRPRSNIYLLRTPNGEDPRTTADRMADDLRLVYSEPNFFSESPEGNPSSIGGWGGYDPGPYTNQKALQQLNVAKAQTYSRGAGTIVAVLDTGLLLNHPAFANRLTPARYDFVEGDAVPQDAGNGRDDDRDGQIDEMIGHGTHVAGIIHVIAPDAKIMPLRVLNSDGRGDMFTVVDAILYAVEQGAHVINLSLGTSARSDALRDVLRQATRGGSVVVAAAGNLNTRNEQYPAADQCALAVASVASSGVKSSFSSFGKWIDVVAPGEKIYSAYLRNGYGTWSGTSMATPFVAGQVALLHSRKPTLNAVTVAALIGNTAQPVDDLNARYDGQLGAGRIDMGASLRVLASGKLPTSNRGMISSSCVD